MFFSMTFNKKANFSTSKKDSYAFKNITPNKKGLITNFFSKKDVLDLYKDFNIIELKEEIHYIHIPKKIIFSSDRLLDQ